MSPALLCHQTGPAVLPLLPRELREKCCQQCDGVEGCGFWVIARGLGSFTPKKTTLQEDRPGPRTRQGRLYSAAVK